MTIGKLSGQCDFGQKGQSYCNQRGQSCVAKRVKVAWLFQTDEEAAESLEWDIAFDRNYIRTNSGEGCKGNGGALDMNKTEFDDVPNLPTSGYEKDKTATIQNSPMSSQKEIETAINPAFVCHEVEGTWFYVAGMGGGYEYNNNVFGILCADGTTKAKLIMRSYGSSQIIFEFVYPAR